MKTRLLSAGIGIVLALGLIILGAYFPIVIDISLAGIASMCIVEGLSAKKLDKKYTILIPCMAFCVLFFLFSVIPDAFLLILVNDGR